MQSMKQIIFLFLSLLIFKTSFSQQRNNKRFLANKFSHMKLPPTVLPDADGDGVTDQFDKDPNTPKGCPVDTHGISLDTDRDGIPDCKDKEPLTKRECFPVDSLGKGVCPKAPNP